MARDRLSDALRSGYEAALGAGEQARDRVDDATDRAEDVTDRARSGLRDTGDRVRGGVERVRETPATVSERVGDPIDDAPRRVRGATPEIDTSEGWGARETLSRAVTPGGLVEDDTQIGVVPHADVGRGRAAGAVRRAPGAIQRVRQADVGRDTVARGAALTGAIGGAAAISEVDPTEADVDVPEVGVPDRLERPGVEIPEIGVGVSRPHPSEISAPERPDLSREELIPSAPGLDRPEVGVPDRVSDGIARVSGAVGEVGDIGDVGDVTDDLITPPQPEIPDHTDHAEEGLSRPTEYVEEYEWFWRPEGIQQAQEREVTVEGARETIETTAPLFLTEAGRSATRPELSFGLAMAEDSSMTGIGVDDSYLGQPETGIDVQPDSLGRGNVGMGELPETVPGLEFVTEESTEIAPPPVYEPPDAPGYGYEIGPPPTDPPPSDPGGPFVPFEPPFPGGGSGEEGWSWDPFRFNEWLNPMAGPADLIGQHPEGAIDPDSTGDEPDTDPVDRVSELLGGPR
ncbi:hypothetical protein AB7C87_01785 [Natrarchaeobius sp. A-rgal3]|uniref:hypothetical protein n=1 Tax=Natrarchaeobius versutus TaxID=1679078 RepID=UPI00350EF89C